MDELYMVGFKIYLIDCNLHVLAQDANFMTMRLGGLAEIVVAV
jgi:hypothetical protein